MSDEKIKLIIDLVKWFIGSVVIVIVTLIIDNSFKERTAGLQEMEAFNKYVETILKADNIEERWKLTQFFATVTPTERLRNSWVNYKEEIADDYTKYKSLRQEELTLTKQRDSILLVKSNLKDSMQLLKANLALIKIRELQKTIEPLDKKLLGNVEEVIFGQTKSTPELNEVRFHSNDDCYPISDGKYCFKKTVLSVKVPNSGWAFTGVPYIDLVEDNQGSAVWNSLGAPDRFKIISDGMNEKVVEVLTASRSIKIRLACKAKKLN